MQFEPLATSIIHTTDLSTMSERAFNHGLSLALRLQAAFTIAHVSADSPQDMHWAQFPAVRDTLQRWGLLERDSQRTDVADKLGIQVQKVNIHNRTPLRPIVGVIKKHKAGLVVLATHGRDGLPRWLHPSIAEPIARTARVPTLFVPSESAGFVDADSGSLNLRRILLPIDTTPNPSLATRTALQLARISDATEPVEVTLLHVGESEAITIPQQLKDEQVNWQVRSVPGDVIETIINNALVMKTDLIIMPTQGHQGFLDALRGSTTEQVLRQAPCPLLAVPAQ